MAAGPQAGKELGPGRGKRERVVRLGQKREERERRGIWGFFFFKLLFKLLKIKLFSNFANFTQTKNHAFEL
jgi:hypothetical protein